MSEGSERPHSRFGEDNPNLALWIRNETTDIFVGDDTTKRATKGFSRGGGFSGTSVNATYIVKRLTAEFGPVGMGWGVEPEQEDYRQGAPILEKDTKAVIGHEVIHILRVEFWYVRDGKRYSFRQYGQTTFIGSNKYGAFTDEEAPKKSLTDALSKAASWLGFAADVHLGMWDDNKRVENRAQEVLAERRAERLSKPYAFINPDGDIFHAKDAEAWKADWIKRIKGWITAKSPGVLAEAWRGNEEAIESTRAVDPDAVAEIEAMVQEAVQSGKEPAPRQAGASGKPAGGNGATRPPAEQNPGPPPNTFDLLGPDGVRHPIGRNVKNGRAAHEVWLTAWGVALDRITQGDKLTEWFKANTGNLATIRRYFPAAADEAERLCRARCERLRVPYPDALAGQAAGAAGK